MDGFQRRREQKKLDILKAALSLFMEYGIQKVSVSEIAKEAKVSQVTIYNYFENKHNLVHEVCIHYVDKEWLQFEELLYSSVPFPEKIKQIIFNKKETARTIHEDFYQSFMLEYTSSTEYIEKMYAEKFLPLLTELFNQGREQGFVDPDLSTEAILLYMQILRDAMQREDIYRKILPLTEDITKLLFYGIVGRKEDHRGNTPDKED